MLVLVIINFIVLCMVSACHSCDEWVRVQVAINEWHGDLNVITDLSHNDVNLQLLFGEYNELVSKYAIKVNNSLMEIQLLAKYDEHDNPVLRGIVINGVDICEKSGVEKITHQIPQLKPPPRVTVPSYYEIPRVTYTIPEECGITIPEVTPYIHYGNQATVSEFPWHAAIFDMPHYGYRCGGSLIARHLVVTAAHCVTKTQTNYPISQTSIIVVLGKNQLQTTSIVEQTSEVAEIHVHNSFDPNSFNNDIAVIKLQTPMLYTNFVRPVCIWPHSNDRIGSVVDMYGTIPGFGYNEHWYLSDQLASVKMPIVSYETCLSAHREFYARVISSRNFCAGSLNGSSVCNGDSGGGMVFKINSLFYLRGIVSIGPSDTIERTHCNTKYYIVFTDVAKYVDWLEQF